MDFTFLTVLLSITILENPFRGAQCPNEDTICFWTCLIDLKLSNILYKGRDKIRTLILDKLSKTCPKFPKTTKSFVRILRAGILSKIFDHCIFLMSLKTSFEEQQCISDGFVNFHVQSKIQEQLFTMFDSVKKIVIAGVFFWIFRNFLRFTPKKSIFSLKFTNSGRRYGTKFIFWLFHSIGCACAKKLKEKV